MMKSIKLATLIGLSTICQMASAAIIGNANVKSYVGETLRVEIPVMLNKGSNSPCFSFVQKEGEDVTFPGIVEFDPVTNKVIVKTNSYYTNLVASFGVRESCSNGSDFTKYFTVLLDYPSLNAGSQEQVNSGLPVINAPSLGKNNSKTNSNRNKKSAAKKQQDFIERKTVSENKADALVEENKLPSKSIVAPIAIAKDNSALKISGDKPPPPVIENATYTKADELKAKIGVLEEQNDSLETQIISMNNYIKELEAKITHLKVIATLMDKAMNTSKSISQALNDQSKVESPEVIKPNATKPIMKPTQQPVEQGSDAAVTLMTNLFEANKLAITGVLGLAIFALVGFFYKRNQAKKRLEKLGAKNNYINKDADFDFVESSPFHPDETIQLSYEEFAEERVRKLFPNTTAGGVFSDDPLQDKLDSDDFFDVLKPLKLGGKKIEGTPKNKEQEDQFIDELITDVVNSSQLKSVESTAKSQRKVAPIELPSLIDDHSEGDEAFMGSEQFLTQNAHELSFPDFESSSEELLNNDWNNIKESKDDNTLEFIFNTLPDGKELPEITTVKK